MFARERTARRVDGASGVGEDHAVESRLFPERYVEIVSAAVLAALDNPIGKQ